MQKKQLTYTQAVAEIDEIVAQLDNNELDMDNLLAKVKRASELIEFCRAKLRATEDEVQKIIDAMNE